MNASADMITAVLAVGKMYFVLLNAFKIPACDSFKVYLIPFISETLMGNKVAASTGKFPEKR